MSFIPAKKETNSTTQKGKLSICLATILTRLKKKKHSSLSLPEFASNVPSMFFFSLVATPNGGNFEPIKCHPQADAFPLDGLREKKTPTWWLPVLWVGPHQNEKQKESQPLLLLIWVRISLLTPSTCFGKTRNIFSPSQLPFHLWGEWAMEGKKTRVFNLLLKLPPSPWNRVLPGWEEFTSNSHTLVTTHDVVWLD